MVFYHILRLMPELQRESECIKEGHHDQAQ
jgi:hypothetical protein